jgi:hypothetical protein
MRKRNRFTKWPSRSSLLIPLRYSLLIILVGGGGWALWWWIRYPHAPNVKQAPLVDCVAFMGSADFNRMTHRDRTRYAVGLIDKLHDKSFADLLAMSLQRDAARKSAADNIRQLDKDEQNRIGSAFMQLFLTKFYEQDAARRTAYLFGMVMMQKTGNAAATAKKFGLPKPEQFKNSLAEFITTQPPHAQAQLSQFMLDVSKEQRVLGVKGW